MQVTLGLLFAESFIYLEEQVQLARYIVPHLVGSLCKRLDPECRQTNYASIIPFVYPYKFNSRELRIADSLQPLKASSRIANTLKLRCIFAKCKSGHGSPCEPGARGADDYP